MYDDKDIHGNPICGQDFMAGTICTLLPNHDGFHAPICQECGHDWYLEQCDCRLTLELDDYEEDLPDETL